MYLSVDERKLFYKNWLKLLIFVNEKHKIVHDFGKPDSPVGLNIQDIGKIKKRLWENNILIDEYIKTSNLNKNDFQIVNFWKKHLKGKFVIIKELKKYCIFLNLNDNMIYGVKGISSPFSEMIPYFPYMIETVLIPFNGKIIYDSIIEGESITFGSSFKKSFNEKYIEIKNKKEIITKLE